MEIEDIINKVRYTTSEEKKAAQPQSTCESTATNTLSVTRSAPDPTEYLDDCSSGDFAAHDSDESLPNNSRDSKTENARSGVPQNYGSLASRQRARTTSEPNDLRTATTKLRQRAPPPANSHPYAYYAPMVYVPAYIAVPMHGPFVRHNPAHSSNFTSPTPQQRFQPQSTYKQEPSTEERPARGVRLSPLPQSLRRAQATSKRKLAQPKEKKRHIRSPPTPKEYDHLNIEDAMQELARRGIYTSGMEVDDFGKGDLVRLLQRADRNNNRGKGKGSRDNYVPNMTETTIAFNSETQ